MMTEQNVITADMRITQVINQYPNAVGVFMKHGMGCIGCAAARFETIGQGARAHGIDLEQLLADLSRCATT